jgi:hypothetical protein
VGSDPPDRFRDRPDGDRKHHEVRPIEGRRRILERLLDAPQRYRLRAVSRVMINAPELMCQAAATAGKSQAAADQAEADDRDPAEEREPS